MTVRQLTETMDCVEYEWWGCHFARKIRLEKEAIDNAKRGR